jgi:hypothetical protein
VAADVAGAGFSFAGWCCRAAACESPQQRRSAEFSFDVTSAPTRDRRDERNERVGFDASLANKARYLAFAAVVLADDPQATVSWTLRRTESGETW